MTVTYLLLMDSGMYIVHFIHMAVICWDWKLFLVK